MREIDLTHSTQMPYSVRSMDSQNEQPPNGEAFNDVSKRSFPAPTPEERSNIEREWEEKFLAEGLNPEQLQRAKETTNILSGMGMRPSDMDRLREASEEDDGNNDEKEDQAFAQRFIDTFANHGINQETAEKIMANSLDKNRFIEAGRRIFELGINDDEHRNEQAEVMIDEFTKGVEGVDKDQANEAYKEWLAEEVDKAIEAEASKKMWEEINDRRLSDGKTISQDEKEAQRAMVKKGLPPISGGAPDTDEGDREDMKRQFGQALEAEYVARGYSPEDAARLVTDRIFPDKPIEDISDDKKPEDERVNQKPTAQLMKEYEAGVEKLARENNRNIAELENEGLRDLVNQYREEGVPEESIRDTIEAFIKQNSTEGIKQSLENYIRNSQGRIDRSRTAGDIQGHLDSLWDAYKEDLERFDKKKYEEFLVRKEKLADTSDINDLKKHGKDFVEDIALELHGFGAKEGKNRVEVNSAEQLFQLIMDAEGTDWRKGGIFELIDKEGNLHVENFMAWIRYKITYFITEYSPDDPINLMSEIAVETPYKTINFGTMYGTPKYFMRRDIRKDERAGEVQQRIVNDPKLDMLKTKAIMEVWPMGENHNNDAQYRSAMGQAKMLQEVLPKVHYKELYTKSRSRFNSFVRLPGIEDIEMRTDDALNKDGPQFQGDVGKTHQRSINAYRYLPDRFMFRKVFNGGKDQVENSESLDAFYHSVIEQSFADRFKTLADEKKQEYRDNNYGRSPDDDVIVNFFYKGTDKARFLQELRKAAGGDSIGKDVPEDMKSSLRFFQLLNKGEAGGNLLTRGLNLTPEDYLNLVNEPEYFALKAITYKFANSDNKDFNNLAVINPRDPYSGFETRTRNIEGRKKELAANEKKMKHEDVKKARLDIWKDEEALKKERDSIHNKIDGAYDVFNIFSQVKREQTQVDLVSKAISAGLLRQLQLDREKKVANGQLPKVDENDPNYEFKMRRIRKRQMLDAEYGTLWGAKEAYWTGISAFNDTNAIGFDKWSNEINTKDYRMRQGSGRGPFGLKDTVWGFRRLTFNFWDGLKVRVEGDPALSTPLMEVIQGGAGDEMDLDKEIPNFDFEGHAQRQWMVDHVMPAFKIADFLFDKHGMDLNKYFTRDHRGKLIIDKEKSQELIQEFVWHDLRYIIDQSGFNWDKQMRLWWREYDETGASVVRFGSKSKEEYMFDEEVINMNMYKRKEVPGGDGARARNAFAYQISKEIAYHMRDAEGTYKWGLTEVSAIKQYFNEEWGYGQRPVDKKGNAVVTRDGKQVAVDKNGKVLYENAKVNRVEPAFKFFSEEEMEDFILDPAGANTKKLKNNLFWNLVLILFASSAWGMIKEAPKVANAK